MSRAWGRLRPVVASIVGLALGACGGAGGGAVSGVYTNADGNTSIEFLKDGKAHFSLHGLGGECTYTQSGKNVVLTCDGETTEFTIGDDGALAGPPDGFMTRMKKKE